MLGASHFLKRAAARSTLMTLAAHERYTPLAMALHWLLALAIVGALGVGVYMAGLPVSPARLKLYSWHKWAGVTILLLSALRLLWRLGHRPPALPAQVLSAMPPWQRVAHHGVHHLMYVLFFAVPLTGWAYSSAAGFPIVWFGVLPLPDFVPVDKALAQGIKPWHAVAAFTLAALVVLHVAAALKHQFVDRDGLLDRMRPARRLQGLALWGALGALGWGGLATPGWAATPGAAQLVAARSDVVFVSTQMGVPVEGRFRRFDAQVVLDPRQPQSGRVSFVVDLASASMGAPEAEAELGKPEWFDVARFAQARFVSSSVRGLGGGRFEVRGTLTLKGVARELVVPVQLAQSGGASVATGSVAIKRTAFKIGSGEWADPSLVADEVSVRFRLTFTGMAPL